MGKLGFALFWLVVFFVVTNTVAANDESLDEEISNLCSAALQKAGGSHARCLLETEARFQRTGNLAGFLNQRDTCDARFDRKFDRAIQNYSDADCTAVSRTELMSETDRYVLRYSNVAKNLSNESLLGTEQYDVPSGLAWLGNPSSDAAASWSALDAAGFKGVVIDIGVSEATLEALSDSGAIIVLSISNSVGEWAGWEIDPSWQAKIDSYASAIAIDTESGAPCTWMNTSNFASAFQNRNLFVSVDNGTCQDAFLALQQAGGWKIRFIGDAYSSGNKTHIEPVGPAPSTCTDVVQTAVYAVAGVPPGSVDPVGILGTAGCEQAAGNIFFDCTLSAPCEADDITQYMGTAVATSAMAIVEQRPGVNFGPPTPTPKPPGPSKPTCSAAFCMDNPWGTCTSVPGCTYCNNFACHD